MNNEKRIIRLTGETTHDQAKGIMTASWHNGLVEVITEFVNNTTNVFIDKSLRRAYENLTVKEYASLLCEMQDEADEIEKKLATQTQN